MQNEVQPQMTADQVVILFLRDNYINAMIEVNKLNDLVNQYKKLVDQLNTDIDDLKESKLHASYTPDTYQIIKDEN